MNGLMRSNVVLACFLALATSSSLAQRSAAFESPPAVAASEIAPAQLLSGPFHKVREPVTIESHLGRFVIDSKFGVFSVHGANMLAIRVGELQAIDALQKVQTDTAFQDAVAKSAGGVAKFAESTVSDPAKTVENIGKGIGTVFGRIGYMAKSGVQYAGDKASDATSSMAKPQSKGALSNEPEPPLFTGDPFGYNKARREWAKKLNIDPYTSNPVLRPLLDNAASASFAGDFAVNLAVGAAIGPLQYAYTFDDTVQQAVWDKPPIDLAKANQEKLLALNVPDVTVRNLLRNRWFTPTLQTALVNHLVALGPIDGVASVVTAASATQGESRARFLLESIAMLAAHHRKEGRLAKIRMTNLVPVGVAADGSVVAAVAIDYGIWDQEAAAFAQRKELANDSRTLLVAGNLSPRARRDLGQAGWKVKTGLRLQ